MRSQWPGPKQLDATIPPCLERQSRCAAADEFRHLALIASIFLSNGECNLLRNFVSRAPSDRIEWECCGCGRSRGSFNLPTNRLVPSWVIRDPADWLGIEHVALLADVDLGFEMRHLEVVVALLQHPPKRHVWVAAVIDQILRGHAEWISL